MEIVSFVKIGTTLWGPAKLTRSAELHLQWASVPLAAGRLPLVASSSHFLYGPIYRGFDSRSEAPVFI